MRCGDEARTGVHKVILSAIAALALASCSTVGGDGAETQAGQRQDSFATKLLLGTANPSPIQPKVDDSLKSQCPPVDVLAGTASFTAYDTPGATDPFSIRYQANITDTARECSSLGVEAAIRVGVTGRVIVGPKGGPGTVRLPLRIAVVDEKGAPLYSQVRTIDVVIPAGQTQADFPHLEEGIVVPIPENRFRGWKILVGYDPAGASAPARTRTSRSR